MAAVRRARIVLLVVVVVAVVCSLVGVVLVSTAVERPQPDYAGSATVPGLNGSVRVTRDEHGVPQVSATTTHDLFYAQGYTQAQDQFFAMDFRRHVASGRLAELTGTSAAVASDTVARTLGWRQTALREWGLLSPAARAYLQAYSDGVNAYLSGRSKSELSVSYTVLGFHVRSGSVRPWSPVDSLAWLGALSWDLESNYTDEVDRATALGAVDDVRRVNQLFPDYDSDAQPTVVDDDQSSLGVRSVGTALQADTTATKGWSDQLSVQAGKLRKVLSAVPNLVGEGAGLGSNAWVVSGTHTNTGEPLLAADPHLALDVPGFWYQSALRCSRVTTACPFDVSGAAVAGLPGILLGHTGTVAWSLTNMGADVTDLYVERVRGDQYLRDGKWRPLTVRRETIHVAGGKDVTVTVRSTDQGPVLSDATPELRSAAAAGRADANSGEAYAMAVRWAGAVPGRTLQAVFDLDRSATGDDVRRAVRNFTAPAVNVLWAETSGRIGYQAAGLVPVRSKRFLSEESLPTDGTWPQPGWTSATDWRGWVAADRLPHVENPASGFIVTANQQVTDDNSPDLGSDWDYGYRASTITTAIEDRIKHRRPVTVAWMTELQNNTTNPFAKRMVPYLLKVHVNAFTRQARDLLRDWDGSQPADSAAAAYFNAVWAHVLQLTFNDELPAGARADGSSQWFSVVDDMLRQPDNAWWDSKLTPSVVETRDSILAKAMVDARKELTTMLGKDPQSWQWGRIHRLEFAAPAEPSKGAARRLLGIGAVDAAGSTGAVDATNWDASKPGDYGVTSGPGLRMVVDLGAFDRSTWVAVPGVSGHPWTRNYADQVPIWSEGRTSPWPFSGTAVAAATKHELTLRSR